MTHVEEGIAETVTHRVTRLRYIELKTLHPPHPNMTVTAFVPSENLFEKQRMRVRLIGPKGDPQTKSVIDQVINWSTHNSIQYSLHRTTWGTEYVDIWIDHDELFAYTMRWR